MFCGHWGLPVVTLVWSVQLSLLLLILPRPFGLDSWIVFSSLFSLVYLRLITIYFVFVYFLVNAMQLSFDSVSLLCIAFVVLFRLFPHKCYGIDFHLRYYFKGQTGLDVSFFKCLDLWQTLAIILLLKQFISTVSSKMLCLALFWGGGGNSRLFNILDYGYPTITVTVRGGRTRRPLHCDYLWCIVRHNLSSYHSWSIHRISLTITSRDL